MKQLKIYSAKDRMPKQGESIIVWGTIGFASEPDIPEPWVDTAKRIRINPSSCYGIREKFLGVLERDNYPFDETMKYSLASDAMEIIRENF